jgi:uncharacterized protein (DUF4415 family)
MSRKSKNTLTSLDRKKRITKREFDRLFDKGSDEIDAFIDWSKAEVDIPGPKQPVALRLDADVVDWFRSSGKGYQTRINAVLRSYKRAKEREAAAAKGK